MERSLIQKRLFNTATVSIEYNGVKVIEQSPTTKLDYFIEYENIPSSRFAVTQYEKVGIILTVVCVIVSVILVISMMASQNVTVSGVATAVAFTAVPALLTYFSRTEFIGFGTTSGGIRLRANIPSRAAVEAFLETLQQAKVQYLRDVYLQKELPSNAPDALRLLLLLKNHGALSEEEFEERKKRISASAEHAPIGFGVKG